MASGQIVEAVRIWEQVLALDPDQPQALLYLGQNALRSRNFTGARAFLERAAVASPNEPVVQLGLAIAAQALGDDARELAALNRALAIDPYCYPALLSKALLTERQGKPRQAARMFRDALTIIPQDEQRLSREIRDQIQHAREAAGRNAEAMARFLDARLGGEPSGRIAECKDVLAGAKKVYTQQPMMLHVPGLPAISYYEHAQFPWLSGLESKSDIIRGELEGLLQTEDRNFRPYVQHPDGAPLNQWAELNRSARWSAQYLWKDGQKIAETCARCPKTAEIMAALPLAQMAGFGPTVFFSALEPHTRIPPHTGDTNARLIVHLPLILPGQCAFRVGNDVREWKFGEAFVFDDTIEHEAWNDSDEIRVVLIFDIWNPYLTPAERDHVVALLSGMQGYYAAEG